MPVGLARAQGADWPAVLDHVGDDPHLGRLPRALFLVPGYGAQGAPAADAVRGFVPGPAGLEGGVVSASRAIHFPEAAAGTTDAAAWERAVDDALARAIDELGSAVQRG